MIISEEIKTIDSKIEQNKAQYNLDRNTAKISALSLGNVVKYNFSTGKYILPGKDLLEKGATGKTFENSSLGNKVKAQALIAKKHSQKLHNTFEFDKIINKTIVS